MFGKGSGQTVRPDSRWKAGKWLYAVVFVVIAGSVYGWGYRHAETPPSGTFSSTARVIQDSGAAAPAAVEGQIVSEANLQRALRQLASTVKPSPGKAPQAAGDGQIGPLREKIRVSAGAGAESGESTVAITCTDADPQFAARLVNALATNYAADRRRTWQSAAERSCREAQQAADRATAEWQSAERQLSEFLELHLEQSQPQDQDSPASRRAQPAPPEKEPAVAEPTEAESRAVALMAELAQLRQDREALLVDLTPIHPRILKIESRIAALEGDLAKIPPQALVPKMQPPEPAQTPVEQAPPMPAEAIRQQFAELKAATDRAAKDRDRAAAVAMQAREAQANEPQIRLQLAQIPEVFPTPAPGMDLLWMALAAGIATAAGVGMVVTGAGIEPTLSTFAQAEAALPAPVIGAIPETDPTGVPRDTGNRQSLARRTLIFGGLILLAGCVGMVFGIISVF